MAISLPTTNRLQPPLIPDHGNSQPSCRHLLLFLAQRLLHRLDYSPQVREFVIFFDRLTVERVMPFLAEQFGQQRALMPAFV